MFLRGWRRVCSWEVGGECVHEKLVETGECVDERLVESVLMRGWWKVC